MDALMNNDFFKWFFICVMKKYADFKGRARRKEYWMFILVYMIFEIVLGILAGILPILAILLGIFCLALIIPSLAVAVRRLHDIGKSGWFLLLMLIPLVGPLIILYFMVKAGDQGANKFGPDPKA